MIFNIGNLSDAQKVKLRKIVFYIICVYVPTFLMIHLNPKAPEGPFLTLFQRDLLAAYQEVEPEITSNVMKYYVQHAS